MYRVGLESILGFTKRGETLSLDPRVPSEWPEYTIEYRYGKSVYTITVERPAKATSGNQTVTLDGQTLDSETIPLTDDGARHTIVIRPAKYQN
jgi:cyclic beta-1,2-glucan glucanotransferase